MATKTERIRRNGVSDVCPLQGCSIVAGTGTRSTSLTLSPSSSTSGEVGSPVSVVAGSEEGGRGKKVPQNVQVENVAEKRKGLCGSYSGGTDADADLELSDCKKKPSSTADAAKSTNEESSNHTRQLEERLSKMEELLSSVTKELFALREQQASRLAAAAPPPQPLGGGGPPSPPMLIDTPFASSTIPPLSPFAGERGWQERREDEQQQQEEASASLAGMEGETSTATTSAPSSCQTEPQPHQQLPPPPPPPPMASPPPSVEYRCFSEAHVEELRRRSNSVVSEEHVPPPPPSGTPPGPMPDLDSPTGQSQQQRQQRQSACHAVTPIPATTHDTTASTGNEVKPIPTILLRSKPQQSSSTQLRQRKKQTQSTSSSITTSATTTTTTTTTVLPPPHTSRSIPLPTFTNTTTCVQQHQHQQQQQRHVTRKIHATTALDLLSDFDGLAAASTSTSASASSPTGNTAPKGIKAQLPGKQKTKTQLPPRPSDGSVLTPKGGMVAPVAVQPLPHTTTASLHPPNHASALSTTTLQSPCKSNKDHLQQPPTTNPTTTTNNNNNNNPTTTTTTTTSSLPKILKNYVKTEMLTAKAEGSPEKDCDVNMEEFLRVPHRLERLLWLGLLVCTDSYLNILTILPLKCANSFLCLVWTLLKKGGGKSNSNNKGKQDLQVQNQRMQFHRRHLYQLQQSFILVFVIAVLLRISVGMLYHWIRGQTMLKLYLVIAIVEVFDRLMCSFGQDALDSLYWNTTRRPYHVRTVVSFVVVLVYAVIHSGIMFVHIATLNVAMNSADQALLSLLIGGNFAEIKSTVFKKYNAQNLFNITTSDMCERFKLVLFLCLILLLNVCQGGTQKEIVVAFVQMSVTVLVSEVLCDWIKHSFITKFNHIRSGVYGDYALIIAGDVTGVGHAHATHHEAVSLDHTHAVVKRVGLAQIPLVCVMARYMREALRYTYLSTYGQQHRQKVVWGMVAIFAVLLVLKIVLGVVLATVAERILEGERFREHSPSISAAGGGGNVAAGAGAGSGNVGVQGQGKGVVQMGGEEPKKAKRPVV